MGIAKQRNAIGDVRVRVGAQSGDLIREFTGEKHVVAIQVLDEFAASQPTPMLARDTGATVRYPFKSNDPRITACKSFSRLTCLPICRTIVYDYHLD